MTCAFCRKDINRLAAWKGQSDQFYCSEFCAEVETMESEPPPADSHVPALPRA